MVRTCNKFQIPLVQEAALIVRWYLEKSKDKFLHGVCSGTIGQQTFKLLRLALKSSKDFTGQHFEMLVFPLDIKVLQVPPVANAYPVTLLIGYCSESQ